MGGRRSQTQYGEEWSRRPDSSSRDGGDRDDNCTPAFCTCRQPWYFLSLGRDKLDEDNEETATLNLNAMNKAYPSLPWHVSFSYGKALQKTAIVTWMGKTENKAAAQAALVARAKANSEATKGTYVAGSCKSIGAAGNVEMQGGAY